MQPCTEHVVTSITSWRVHVYSTEVSNVLHRPLQAQNKQFTGLQEFTLTQHPEWQDRAFQSHSQSVVESAGTVHHVTHTSVKG